MKVLGRTACMCRNLIRSNKSRRNNKPIRLCCQGSVFVGAMEIQAQVTAAIVSLISRNRMPDCVN